MRFFRPSVFASLGLSVLLIAGAYVFSAPQFALADTPAQGAYNAPATGLVPCNGIDCQACSIVALIQTLINFLIGLSIPIAMALFAWAGVLYFTAATKEENITKAHSIFSHVFIGFIIVLGAYLMVETLLHAILNEDYFTGWNKIECVNPDKRLTNGQIGDLLKEVLGQPAPLVVGAFTSVECPSGSHSDATLQGGSCVSDTTGLSVEPISVTRNPGSGSCSAYGLNSQQSCVASFESSCNPSVGSSVDIGSDGNPVSWGLFQINLSANDVTCSNINGGQTIDCTSAFKNGAYTADNHATAVADAALFQTCKNAAQNVDCNKQMQQKIQTESGGSLKPWGTPAQNNCSAR